MRVVIGKPGFDLFSKIYRQVEHFLGLGVRYHPCHFIVRHVSFFAKGIEFVHGNGLSPDGESQRLDHPIVMGSPDRLITAGSERRGRDL